MTLKERLRTVDHVGQVPQLKLEKFGQAVEMQASRLHHTPDLAYHGCSRKKV